MMPQLTTENVTSVHNTTCTTGPVPSSSSATPIVPGPPNSWGIPHPLHRFLERNQTDFVAINLRRGSGRGKSLSEVRAPAPMRAKQARHAGASLKRCQHQQDL
jgi:hypothetical protein